MVVVATKGAFRAGQGKPELLRSHVAESLGRLRTDSIPLYHLHRVDPETPLEESMGVIKEYRDRGAIDPAGPVFEGTPSVLGSPNSPTYTGATALRASMPQVCSHTTRHASGVSAVEPSWHHGTGRLPPPTRSCHADEIASGPWPQDGAALRDYGDAHAMDPQIRWFRYLIDCIGELGASWAYWPLNGMNSPGGGRDSSQVEGFGLLTRDGRGPSNESLLAQLRTIQRAPPRTASLRSDSRVQEQDANGGVDEHD